MKLTNEQDAIKQAVEAGYRPGAHRHVLFNYSMYEYALGCTFDDPAFWQALGKARGFKTTDKFWTAPLCSGCGNESSSYECCGEAIPIWRYHALRYFETRLSDGDLEAFWQSLP